MDCISSLGSLPDVDGVEGMVRKLLGSSWVEKNYGQTSVATMAFPHLTLPQLRNMKGFFTSWGEGTETVWLQNLLQRLAPPATADLNTDTETLSAYCDEVWAVLDKTSMAVRTANNTRVRPGNEGGAEGWGGWRLVASHICRYPRITGTCRWW